MKKIFIIIMVLSSIFITQSSAEVFYITNNTDLQRALERAIENREHDIFKISRRAALDPVDYQVEIGFSITIEGGYSEDFTSRSWKKPESEDVIKPDGMFVPAPQQSKTGPIKPDYIEEADSRIFFDKIAPGGTEKIIGVPPYIWRHGCGPTAVGMVFGYWDTAGCSKLFEGNASTQTDSVNQGIASQRNSTQPGHYEDYSLPMDSGQASPLPDKSELPQGDEHVNDCIADFMETSWSASNNFYGWSISNRIGPSFLAYQNFTAPQYGSWYQSYYMPSTLTWGVLTNEIDNNRPMVFLVDTSADGFTDHFVTIVGYRDTGGILQYGCLDTWYSTVRWCNFSAMADGVPWGIWGGWSFAIASLSPPKNIIPPTMLLLNQ